MKRYLELVIILLLAFVLIGCGEEAPDVIDNTDTVEL